jgi:hypothetical protein
MVSVGSIESFDQYICVPNDRKYGFENWNKVPVHFVGSISHYFKHCLEEACRLEGVRLGNIIKKPIDGLVNYHVKFVFHHAE